MSTIVIERKETDEMQSPSIPRTMRAVPFEGFGTPTWGPIERPVPDPAPDRYLVEVRAASINPADLHTLHGGFVVRAFNGFKRPADPATGSDVSGVVVATGSEASRFKVGDEVFGSARGSLAEYGSCKALARKPANLTWE